MRTNMIRGQYRSWSSRRGKTLLCFTAMMGLIAACGASAADPAGATKIIVKEFMDTNESFSFKFDKPGTYHYTCSIHPRMVGTIVVQ